MPTDIPALIERLNEQAAEYDRVTEFADPIIVTLCRAAAAALAEQAAALENAWGVADTQRAQLNALTNLEDWPCACCSEDKRDAVCLVHSPHVITLRVQLAEQAAEIERLKGEVKDHAEWAAKMIADPTSEPFRVLLDKNAALRRQLAEAREYYDWHQEHGHWCESNIDGYASAAHYTQSERNELESLDARQWLASTEEK